ncbi:small conductance calcium-activated potassium channel protein-like [Haliotis cracherodii]|uniref:small conductance calcium-activated potassium channel protein-like n=1 Tax=Haliotis cracherodii TaxID=6455 RepID=UPI0039EB0616
MEESALTLGVTSNYTKYDSTETLISDDAGKNYGGMTADLSNNLGYRLRRRKEVLSQRKLIVDISFVLGVLGIAFVIIDTELIFNQVTIVNSGLSTALRVLTSATTGALLLAVVAYHVIGLRLHMARAGFSDWRLAMTGTKWIKLIFELFVCMIHPLPFLDIPIQTVSVAGQGNTLKTSTIPVNAILTILMFLRLYLFGRFIVVHSKLFLDTSVQSLGALSRVKINAQFVFRALMSTMPGVVLTTVMFGMFIINSWNLRVCEMYTNPMEDDLASFPQAMWLTAVTFLTVGYGDLFPHSYCGRLIAGWTGLMGVGIMALSVAVLAKNLEQSRSEKYVHTFVQQIALDKKRKHAAANIIKQMIRIYKLRKAKLPERSSQVLLHRTKLLKAIRAMHEAQFVKIHLQECTVGPVELATGLNDMQACIKSVQEEQRHLGQRIATIEALSLSMSAQVLEIKEIIAKKKIF